MTLNDKGEWLQYRVLTPATTPHQKAQEKQWCEPGTDPESSKTPHRAAHLGVTAFGQLPAPLASPSKLALLPFSAPDLELKELVH